jgi:hypothetical protein
MANLHEDSAHIEKLMGNQQGSNIKFVIAKDKMSATLTLTKYSSLSIPSITDIENAAKQQGILIGFSRKRVIKLLQGLGNDTGNVQVTDIVAKGLPPRNGKNSRIKPLVANNIDKVLCYPKKLSSKITKRGLNAALCVVANAPIAKIEKPTRGRNGINISAQKISCSHGRHVPLKLGINTSLTPHDKNIISADIDGIASFRNGIMLVEDVLTLEKGVNKETGNIHSDGAVIVNGDVTQNMEIIAKGDIIINGFVESAYIHSGADIIITQGATGKMNDEDCQLIATKSIFIMHAQGLDIVAGKDLNVLEQLAYSRVKVQGNITIGSVDKPMGNLFASTIKCGKTLKAGSIGANSGSEINIDFSDEFNGLCNKYKALENLWHQLSSLNHHHENRVSLINSQQIPMILKSKLIELNVEMEAQRDLLRWISQAKSHLHDQKQTYLLSAKLVVNKELFPKVTVALNNNIWSSKREYQRCQIALDPNNWLLTPLG